ncbi:M24 family metallopeptidase [Micromonospora echinofusca]|uniref:M24 family metallopeptidase n=1 Tax=Micromonospora echinofusca TaxID=47858 RepID=A0ABS3VIW6_MICEH|nr:M24 family metallopeptidase [Micromonospora echinofusca]MBO4204411.1 M24 family metallopeptidase [Micromonospora echinofusca]
MPDHPGPATPGGRALPDEPPDELVEAQLLAIRAAETIAASARPGESEVVVHRRAGEILRDLGATGVWSPTTVGFGAGTLSCFPTDLPGDRSLWNLDLGIVDVHPVTARGGWGDCTRTLQQGANPAQQAARQAVERIHAAVLAAATPGMRACDLFAVFQQELARTPYLLLDRLSNIGHSLGAGTSYDEGYLDAWNTTELRGAWAVEPFIGNHLYGVKREDVVWFGRTRCQVIAP